jgi:predicted amidophosphoribosyltransferase
MRIDPHANYPTRECPGCAVEVPANENRCPICGYEFPVRGRLHRHLWWIALGLILLFLLPVLRALR